MDASDVGTPGTGPQARSTKVGPWIALGCLATPFVVGATVIGTFFLIGAVSTGLTWIGIDPSGSSKLPEWAHPAASEKLQDYASCSGNNPERLPCRTMEFGTDRTFGDVLADLEAVFVDHGWSIEASLANSLWVRESDPKRCILFTEEPQFPPQADTSEYLRKRRSYAVIVGVHIDPCWAG
jgi:hypothetical protein